MRQVKLNFDLDNMIQTMNKNRSLWLHEAMKTSLKNKIETINKKDIDKLAERLNFFMEKYDPSFGDEGSINWDELDERQKDFYRLIISRIAVDFYDYFSTLDINQD